MNSRAFNVTRSAAGKLLVTTLLFASGSQVQAEDPKNIVKPAAHDSIKTRMLNGLMKPLTMAGNAAQKAMIYANDHVDVENKSLIGKTPQEIAAMPVVHDPRVDATGRRTRAPYDIVRTVFSFEFTFHRKPPAVPQTTAR